MRHDIASVFLKEHEPDEDLRALTVRMPASTYAYVQRLAEEANLSRNAMAVQILQWGVDLALNELPPEIHVSIVHDVQGPEEAGAIACDRLA